MEVYNSEQEQVEALKAWWDKNGRQAIVALVAFLLAVLGWQAWNDHRNEVAAAASSHYQQMTHLIELDPNQAVEAGRALIANYPDSIYATMASMLMARLAVEDKDLDTASAHLRSAMEQSSQAELAQLARLRLARVELAQGKPQLALATINGGEQSAASDELRGDIMMAMGKKDEARAAYSKALEAYGSVVDKRDLVQIKLDDINMGAAE